jgi:hypothetical protein
MDCLIMRTLFSASLRIRHVFYSEGILKTLHALRHVRRTCTLPVINVGKVVDKV